MELAQRELQTLRTAEEKLSRKEMKAVLNQFKVESAECIDNLDTLRRISQAAANAATP